MLIQHNGAALNAMNNLTKNRSRLSKNLEKLSSGYAINRSGDDAAGLAISEKMRWQITGMGRAMENVHEGEGLVQTGEGALAEVHGMLNRLASLAEQSANGTYDDTVDRAQLQKELESIREEIGRVAESANFNGIELFQDIGLEAERGLDSAREGMQSSNIRIDFTQETHGVQTFDLSKIGTIRDGETFTLRAALSDGRSLACELTAEVDSATGTTRFLDGDGMVVGTQANQAFAKALQQNGDVDSFTFSADGTDKLKATAKTAGSDAPVIISSGLTRGSASDVSRSIAMDVVTAAAGDRLPAIRNSSITTYDGSNADEAVFTVNGKKFAVGLKSTDISKLGADVTYIATDTDTSRASAKDKGNATSEQQNDLEKIAAELSRGTGLDVLYRADGIKLEGGEANNVFVFRERPQYASGVQSTAPSQSIFLSQLLADDSPTLKNIIYEQTVFDFETTQTSSGDANSFDAAQQNLANTLETQIVPQAVQGILSKYPAFNYLNGSSIGIGLRLYSDSSSSTLASVSLSTAYSTSGGVTKGESLTYQLSVNTAKIGSLSDENNRSSLEQTICHEMIHAFMDEATTAGMSGIASTGQSDANRFPKWFIEGMAQTASGPGNWIRGTNLALNASSTGSQIQSALGGSNALATNSTAAQYGTGYLACMYLGYLASGKAANMNDGSAAASKLAEGLSTTLQSLISGKSLNDTIQFVTGGKYNSVSAFENGFAADTDAQAFIQELLPYVATTGTNVGGGIVSGNLSGTNPLPDTALSLNLFKLDAMHTQVQNIYPDGVTVLSGGTTSASGTAPVDGIADPNPPAPVTYDVNPFTIGGTSEAGGALTEGVDWKWDKDTGALTILKAGQYDISKNGSFSGDYTGVIKLADNIDTSNRDNILLNLNNVSIDATKQQGSFAGIDCGSGNANVNITGLGTVKGSGSSAGIQVGRDTSLHINNTVGQGITAFGGTSGVKGGAGIGTAYDADGTGVKIDIRGHVTAAGGAGAAGIGGGKNSSNLSEITVVGEGNTEVNATGGTGGAGIGGGNGGDNSSCSISIDSIGSGTVKLTANGGSQGAGIGAGSHGQFGAIVVAASGTLNANGGMQAAGIGNGYQSSLTGDIEIRKGNITATGGVHGAGIGGSHADNRSGGIKNITISGGTIRATGSSHGTGIGSGCSGKMGTVTITGGTITAIGGDDGAAIGAGANGAGGGASAACVKISGGTVTATGGRNGAGIGSGSTGSTIGTIEITGGIVNAKGSTDSTGIGSGHGGTITGGITISGGTITAKGGMTNDGGNIGGYTDAGQSNPIGVTITDPNNLSIKAGDRGEGGYNTTGVKDADGKQLYAFKLDKGNLELEGDMKFPLKVTAKTANGREYTWELSANGSHDGMEKHKTGASTEDDALYIWMEGFDATLSVKDADGSDVIVPNTKLYFYNDAKVWRLKDDEDVSEFLKKPAYSNAPPSGGDEAEPDDGAIQGKLNYWRGGGIILQVGTDRADRVIVPQFYFSRRALKLDDMDISTQKNAMKTMSIVRSAINRVSDIRGEYGALQNALEHINNNLGVTTENVSAAESLIRDTDIAEEMSGFVKNQILNQSAQAMLSQANGLSQQAVSLMQQGG